MIKNRDWSRMLWVGMGNRLKSDDGAGIYITGQLQNKGLKQVIIAENSIENYIGKINRLKPHSVILIDAVDFGQEPGFYKLTTVNEISDTTSNTHNLSLPVISSFIEAADIQVLGIQPENVLFGTELSKKVKEACNQIVKDILINCPEITCYEHRC
jgi:hydrogenase maturation protease